jgi:CDP-diacylglycerol--serine O-phosphatidyltransferase
MRPINLQKTLFILPNAITLASVFCGIYSIMEAAGGNSPDSLYRAAIAILFGVFFDAMDGRVARMTKTQSEFGVQMDSLADVVTFGIAPCILVYKWGLQQFELGFVISFVYAACGVIRLARFNVMAAREEEPNDHFEGLPIPLAAGVIVSLVVAHYKSGLPDLSGKISIIVLVLLLSGLMVSKVRYRSFKKFKFSKRSLAGILLGSAALFIFAIKTNYPLAFVAIFFTYLIVGLVEGAIGVAKKHTQKNVNTEKLADPHTDSHTDKADGK